MQTTAMLFYFAEKKISTKMKGIEEFVCKQMAVCFRHIKEVEGDNIALRGEVSRVMEEAKSRSSAMGDWSVGHSDAGAPSTSTPREKQPNLDISITRT